MALPEFTSIATNASVWSITIEPPEGRITLLLYNSNNWFSTLYDWNNGILSLCNFTLGFWSGEIILAKLAIDL